jgi:predicted ATPase/class 3 adenylate cyclase
MTIPTGTVTFLFTDIEGSTRLWQDQPQAMAISHARHDAILRAAIESNHGHVFQIVGDAFCAAFHNAIDGLRAVLSAQRGLQSELWGETGPIRVRMGLHTGAAEASADGTTYEGYATLASTQRVMSAAHGGQTLLTQTTCDLLQTALPAGVTLRDMGEHRLKDLRAPLRLYQVNAPDLPPDFPPIKSIDTLPNNLPAQLTSFVGREKEISEVKALLNSARLVTLTGSGGTGKTRLSIEVGTEELAHFANGVWIIELAPLSDPAQIMPALAQAFGLQEMPFNPLTNLVTDYLRDKKLLLVLDNCEHLIQACAHLANDLLHQCAHLKILASSREALGIAGELAYHTPSLAESESTRLFVERARAANPKFALTDSNRSAIHQICLRLDGIPLAIELAAARSKLLSAEQIAARLDDLFRLLVGGSRTALPRQQTLRALIDWSYDLLSEEERQLLRKAAVFMGGWTLEAIEAIADDPNTIEQLEGLVNKSLVVAEERNGAMRYFMLETIRQYAREKLFEAKQAAAARDRHFVYFDQLAEKLWDAYRSPNAQGMQWKSDEEFENMRAALEWGLEHHVETALHLATSLCFISNMSANVAEALGLLKSTLARVRALPDADGEAGVVRQKLIAMALFTLGTVGMGNSAVGLPEVLQATQEAISISRSVGDKRTLGYSLENYFLISSFMGLPDGSAAAEEGYILLTEINDWFGIYIATLNMVRIAAQRGDLDKKQKYLAIIEEMIERSPISVMTTVMFYFAMGFDERMQGNYELAKRYYEKGLDVVKKLRVKHTEYMILSELGHLARAQQDFTQAKEIYKQTIVNWQDRGIHPAIAHQLECFGFLAIQAEEPQKAARLFSAAETLRDKVQSPMTAQERAEYDPHITQLRAMLTDVEFNALWAEGRSMTMEQAIDLALEESHD